MKLSILQCVLHIVYVLYSVHSIQLVSVLYTLTGHKSLTESSFGAASRHVHILAGVYFTFVVHRQGRYHLSHGHLEITVAL